MVHGLYIHIPFCERRCHYCDFNTYEGMTDLAPDYAAAVSADIAARAGEGLRAAPGGLRSVYFGGGTPSLLEAGLLLDLLDSARETFGLAPDAEVTLEANPSTADAGKFRALRRGGFNRISMGFQAAQDRHLEALGRVHRVADSERAWDLARQAGFEDMSLDLMFGLPKQSLPEWEASLDWALERGPEHLSFYGLTVERGTRFHALAARGELPLPGEGEQAGMYEEGIRRVEGAGLAQYEISNFALPGREAVHNRLYWENLPTLGVGAGAWSFVDGVRSGRLRGPAAYIAAVTSGRDPVAESERLEGREARAEEATLALRMNRGLDLGRWAAARGDFLVEFGAALAPAFRAGCLEREGGFLRLTPRGRLLSNEVFLALL